MQNTKKNRRLGKVQMKRRQYKKANHECSRKLVRKVKRIKDYLFWGGNPMGVRDWVFGEKARKLR